MLIFKKIAELQRYLKTVKKSGKVIGFVPTMGALHKGHLSLIKAAKHRSDLTVCSIFVNPTQFNDKKDFEKYPITTASDIDKLVSARCDILFLPDVAEMYPKGFENKRKLNFGFMAETLEGEHRPGHFDGMAQVVEKLLNITTPHFLFMGQKDYQQQLIVGQLIQKRRMKVKLITCPTIREKDGLAMSSRNVRLNEKSRILSIALSRALKFCKNNLAKKDMPLKTISSLAAKSISANPEFVVEYFEIRNARTLKPARSKSEKLIALVAAQIGGVRLIDNMLLN